MSGLTPLSDIPDRFAGDPQAGLAEVLRHIDRPGTKVATFRPLEDPGVWRTEIRILGTAKYTVEYREPDHRLVAGALDSVKAELIKLWLHQLTNVVRAYRGEPTIEYGQRHRVTTIREALGDARSTPETSAPGGQCNHCLGVSRHQSWCPTDPKPVPIARPKAQPVDAFVARVLARRKA